MAEGKGVLCTTSLGNSLIVSSLVVWLRHSVSYNWQYPVFQLQTLTHLLWWDLLLLFPCLLLYPILPIALLNQLSSSMEHLHDHAFIFDDHFLGFFPPLGNWLNHRHNHWLYLWLLDNFLIWLSNRNFRFCLTIFFLRESLLKLINLLLLVFNLLNEFQYHPILWLGRLLPLFLLKVNFTPIGQYRLVLLV